MGNLTIEQDATLVIDDYFEFGYHDYNENGHLLTNNGTIFSLLLFIYFLLGIFHFGSVTNLSVFKK